jgi:hypothetical protein
MGAVRPVLLGTSQGVETYRCSDCDHINEVQVSVPFASVVDAQGKTVCFCSALDHVAMPQVDFPSADCGVGAVQGRTECFWSAVDHVRTPQLPEAFWAWSPGIAALAIRPIRLMQAARALRVVIATSSF